MGKAIAYEIRVKIIALKQKGYSSKSIASRFSLSESGVNKIIRRHQKEGEAAFLTRYSNCGRTSTYTEAVRTEIEKIRDNGQGAYYVRSKMIMEETISCIPSTRTIQRWWAKEQTNRPKGRPKETEKKHGVKSRTIPGK